MRWLTSLVAVLSLGLASCASHQTLLEVQRPPLRNAIAFAVPPGHPFYQTVVVDYVSGMSQHSFLFSEANQAQFRPQLALLLEKSGMLAPTPIAARYGLQIEFVDLDGSSFGATFESRSRAIYRIVERRTGRVAFQKTVDSGFSARFVGLNERDAVALVSLGLLGNPFDVLKLSNYIAPGTWEGDGVERRALAREGDLAVSGYGDRDGFRRGQQADYQMMKQSVAKFVLALSEDQHIPIRVILPCLYNADIEAQKAELEARHIRWVEDDCRAYPQKARPIVY